MAEVIYKPGELLTFATIEKEIKRLSSYFRGLRSKKTIVINVSSVKHCDSAGLALLIEAKRLARQRHIACFIQGMTADLAALAQFCRVEEILALES